MGAINFIEEIEAVSAKRAFEELTEEAIKECGNRGYNGTISTCTVGRLTKKFDKYTKASEKEAYEFIESKGNGSKWEADYVDLGIVGYKVTTVKKTEGNYNAKLKMRYCVTELTYFESSDTNYSYDTKTEANNKALELTLKNNKGYGVEKKYVNMVRDKPSTVCTKFEIETNMYKSKPNLKLADNRKIEEIRKYLFYGWASC